MSTSSIAAPTYSAAVSSRAVNPWIVALAVVIPTFMEVLDTTIANVALRHIAGGLSAAVTDGEWVITSYLAANAIKSSHQQSCEEQVWVCSWIGWTELNTLCRWTIGEGNTYSCAAVALRENQVNRCFKTWYKTLVAVRGGSYNAQ